MAPSAADDERSAAVAEPSRDAVTDATLRPLAGSPAIPAPMELFAEQFDKDYEAVEGHVVSMSPVREGGDVRERKQTASRRIPLSPSTTTPNAKRGKVAPLTSVMLTSR